MLDRAIEGPSLPLVERDQKVDGQARRPALLRPPSATDDEAVADHVVGEEGLGDAGGLGEPGVDGVGPVTEGEEQLVVVRQ